MAQTVIVQLTDDFDGGTADETISFSLSGKSYEIDLNSKNAEKLREAFAPFIEKARQAGRGEGGSRSRSSEKSGSTGAKTLFSTLDAEEKGRFRTWADMPTARRVNDSRVQQWIDAGRP
ncbi:MAG: histone-like nucleoid-structuring protein Lsr2 [Acidimicrobiales bacterium]